MTRFTAAVIAATLGLALAPGLAAADGKGHGSKYRHVVQVQGCPPGLAKKNNGCRPPGLAKKDYSYRYRVGDRIERDYVVIEYPRRYGLDPRETYWRSNDYVYRVNRETGEILDLIGAMRRVLD